MKTTDNGVPEPGSKMTDSNKKADAGAVPEKILARLQAEKEQYRKVRQRQSETDFDSSPDTVYYILSTKFLNEWQEYTGYSDKNPSLPVGQGPEPEEMNADIIVKLKDDVKLKPGLEQHTNFVIVSKDVMLVFKDYPGARIQRKAVRLENNKKAVEVYKLQFQYILLTKKVIEDLAVQTMATLKIERAEISRYARLRSFKALGLDIYKRQEPGSVSRTQDSVRIWKIEPELTVAKYASHLKKYSSTKITQDGYNIPAKAIEYSRDQTVADFSIADDDVVLIQIKDYISGWILSNKQDEKTEQSSTYTRSTMCEYCRFKPVKFACQCNRVEYCSEECKYKDMRYHTRVCKYADEVDTKQQIDMEFNTGSRRGLTGLQNLGNTCFMNSCLQCLSNTIPLTEYFLSQRFMSEINVKNPIGTRGKISINYAKTIKGLWVDSAGSYSPYVLKSSIAEFQPMFSGFSQHDSQQFLSFLLDGLHQDLNRVIVKPTTETIDSKGRPDEVVARQSWVNYLKRNQSVVVDLFMGQYKSKVTCPTCNHQSITFDPYSTLSLPIPQTTLSLHSIVTYVFLANYREGAKKLTVDYSGKSIEQWRKYTANLLRLKEDELAYFGLSFSDPIYQFDDTTPIEKIQKIGGLRGYEIFCLQLTKQDLAIPANIRKYCVFKFVNAKISNDTVFTFKRPMYFDMKKAVGQDIYWRVYKFVFRFIMAKEPSRGVSFWSSSNTEPNQKNFEEAFSTKGKAPPFEIYVRVGQGKQSLLKFEQPINNFSAENGVEFEVRILSANVEDLKKFNNYDDADKSKIHQDYVDDKQYSLDQCFTEFEKAQMLQQGNEWYCPKCKQHKKAMKQMVIYKTPKILIIHLKRFKQKSDKWYATKSKMGCLIDFPHELNMENFTTSKTLPEAYFAHGQDQQPLAKPQPINSNECSKYELYAVSNHYGTMSGGHYTAYAKNDGNWYNFNDSSVHKASSTEVVSKDAYMLFYRRMDTKK